MPEVIASWDFEVTPRTLNEIAAELRVARRALISATQARVDGEEALLNAERAARTRYHQLMEELKLASLGLTPEQATIEWQKGKPV